MLILKGVKVPCFHTLLEVVILKELGRGFCVGADSVVYHRLGLKLLHLRVASTNPEAFITQDLQVQTLKP